MKAGWRTKNLSDVCEIERGGSPRPIDSFLTNDPNGINWVKIGDTKGVTKYIYETQEKIRPEGAKRSRLVVEGDFILSNSMSFGRPYIMKTTGCIHDGWLLLRPKEPRINQDYLYYVLGSDLIFRQFDSLAAGSTVRNLNIGLVKTVRIPVPPPKEQERIVAILDEAFDGIAKAKANTERNLNGAQLLFDGFLESVLSSCEGSPEARTLNEVCLFENGDRGKNYPSKAFRVSEGIPFINAGHLGADGIDFANMNYISQDRFDMLSNGKVRPNDILFCLRGSLGKFAGVGSLAKGAIASSLVIVRAGKSVMVPYLLAYFKSRICAKMVEKYRGGAAQPNLSAESLGDFVIPVPSLSEQRRITDEIEAFRQESLRLRDTNERKLSLLDGLRQSLLHQAFTGKL